ncbi:MAG: FG-GAP repeat protein, partial [Candidatus Marinimicrobia bacterium]|nr:FG-GAP repeat protein [Candidatus Neomarinimicrobiota bacterium]
MLKKTLLLTLTICAAASLSISQPAYAQISEFKITAADGAERDNFGGSVSISGDYAVLGAPFDDDNGLSSGSAYVFKRSGTSWVEEAKITASDGAPDDQFGGSVSISGDSVAVVGAWSDDDKGSKSGSAYVFKRAGTSWAQEAKLLPSDGAADDHFGFLVSISGDYAVVGASSNDDNGPESGSAYVFKRTGTSWAQEAKLLPSDGAAEDHFGASVSISGGYVVVGAWLAD